MLFRSDDSNRIEAIPITHRPLDGHHRLREEDEFIFENIPSTDDDEPTETYDDEFFDDDEDENIDYEWKYGDIKE